MPKFETDVELYIDIHEFFDEMSESEKKEMFKILEKHFDTEITPNGFTENTHFDDKKWNQALISLINKRHFFSDEEMDFILKMADKV